MNQDNNIESFLQNSLEDFKFEPPKKNRRKILLFLWFKNLYKFKIILFAVIGSFVVLFFLGRDIEVDKNTKSKNELVLKDSHFEGYKNESNIKEKISNQSLSFNNNKEVEGDLTQPKNNQIKNKINSENKKSNLHKIKKDIHKNQLYQNTSVKKDELILKNNFKNLNNSFLVNKNENQKLENSAYSESDTLDLIQNQFDSANISELNKEEEIVEKDSIDNSKINEVFGDKEDEKEKIKKYPSVYVDGGILFNQFFSKNKQMDYMPNLGIGLATKILLNNYFIKIGSNIERGQFSYSSNYLKDTLIVNYNSYYNIDTNGTMLLIMNQKLDSTTYQYIMYFDTIVKYSYDSTWVTDTNIVNTVISKNAQQISNLNILTFPLHFGYQFDFNKHVISISSGITTSIILKNSIHQNQFPPNLTLQPRIFNFNYSLNLEYAYFVKPNFAFVTDFWFRENVKSSFVNQNIKNQSFGFLIGCRLKL